VVFWLVTAGLLVAVWAAAANDSSAAADVPLPSGGAWWWALALVTVQAAALLRERTAPRTTVIVVAAAAPVGTALGLGSVLGITSVPVLQHDCQYSSSPRKVNIVRSSMRAPALPTGGIVLTKRICNSVGGRLSG